MKHNSGNWSIEFYAYSPVTEALEHRRIRLNRLRKSYKSTAAFKRHANEIVCELNIQLAGGWSPFGETINSRLYTPLAEAMAEYLDEKRRELRPDTLRSYASFASIFGAWCQAQVPKIYASLFSRLLAVRYLDYIYSQRKVGITNMPKAGIDPLTVMQHADHHDLSMTTRYANHADPMLIKTICENAPNF